MMSVELIRALLGWGAVINLGLLLWWFLFFMLAHDWTYRMHSRWFNLSAERFDTIHYAGMGLFKLSAWVFYIVPYLALRIVS